MQFKWFPAAGLCWVVFALIAAGQPSRINKQINNNDRLTLRGDIHPKARAEYDQGRVSPAMQLSFAALTLGPSEAQRADLERLLADQQTPGSPNYHRWLTPEEFGQRFGPSDSDVAQVTAWLQNQGVTVSYVARGRGWIAFDATAAEAESAFRTEIHNYLVNGELHFANATDPSIPSALAGVVTGVRLHDFRPHARPIRNSIPDYTSSTSGNHYVAPGDLATIYDISPLYNAGIDGTGQKIAIAGQSNITISNVNQFRSRFGLSPNEPQLTLVPGSRNPGIVSGDSDESYLDIEWTGAVARNAQIIYVYSTDVYVSEQYIVDQNLAPVLSESYGLCEPETFRSDATAMRTLAQQANAQGMTWFGPSGDSGAADCNNSQNPGLAVDIPASIPEVTGVGGTQFQEDNNGYWNATSDANGASARSYIPEAAWNDSSSYGSPSASGGGASIYFAKPSWQNVAGVPADNARHVPDVAMNGSPSHDAFLVYMSGGLQPVGGTSAGAPIFAGIGALLNHYLTAGGALSGPGLGNINPNLYALSQSVPQAFHDITTGNNIVTVSCPTRNRFGCSATPVGYSAGPGYDQATGLGSVDVYTLITNWAKGSVSAPNSTVQLTLLTSQTTVAANDQVVLIATVTNPDETTPSGAVTFSAGNSVLGSVSLTGLGATATATLAVTGSQLTDGTLTAAYAGPSGNQTATAAITLSQSAISSTAAPTVSAVTNAASFGAAYAPGALVSVFGSQLAQSAQTAGSVPLPLSMASSTITVNGVVAPLLYVSPGQINFQIPYTTSAGNAAITINNDGQVTSQTISVSLVAPGIFNQNGALVPNASAAAGQSISLYMTGAGAVAPAVSTGGAPSSQAQPAALPRPLQTVAVTVAGVSAPIQFAGNAPGLVGVIQVNFQIPSGVPVGLQPVIVSIGGVASAPVTLQITQ
jgi:uncharacterized protein (TIGR03437 family)